MSGIDGLYLILLAAVAGYVLIAEYHRYCTHP